jgi:fatty acid desaturase
VKNEIVIDWYRVPVERDKLRRLTRRSNLPGLLQSLGHLVLIAATGTAAFFSVGRISPALTIVILFFHGTFYAFLLNGFHELCHRTVFKSRFLNECFLVIYSFLGWFNYVLFRASHTRHHLYTLHPPADLEVVLPVKKAFRTFLLRGFINLIGLFQLPFGTLKTALGKLDGEWQNKLFPESDFRLRKKLRTWAWILVLGHTAISAVFFSLGLWILPVLTTFAPFYGSWLLYLCNDTQHIGLRDKVPDFRLCARTFELNPVVRFLYWQMNYHIEHHMYAAVPFYKLRKLHHLIEKELPPSPKGIVATWKNIASILKKQKQDPSYQYTAQLPDSMGAVD